MKTWKRVALALGIASLLAGATAAIAANGHGRGNFQQRITTRVNRMLDKLNATADQRQAVNQVVNDALSNLQAQHQQHGNPHNDWMSILSAANADQMKQAVNDAQAHAAARAQAMQNASPVIIQALQKVHDILTPAQRQQFAAIAKNHAAQGGFGGPQQ
jgi:Spy/CpxP family protein refolding chaperone